MPYNVEIQVFANHLRIGVSGDREAGDAVADASMVGQQIVAQCRDTGINNILLVLKLAGHASAIDVYKIITESQQYGWNHEMKAAFVDLNAESLSDVQFAETVAVNRAYRVRVFDNEDGATDWLLNT